MQAYLLDWLNLLLRWFHMITGIAWIGASFYFVWLDNHLLAPKNRALADKGVSGELWAVHGGGFYNAQKYKVAPATLPDPLHWFKWEAYTTWISGFFLLCLMYYVGAEVYLIDRNVADIGKAAAIAIGIGSLAGGWLIYDLLCKSPFGKTDAVLGGVLLVLTVAAAWGLCQVFSGRGAYIHFGAMLGTIMVANVFFVIIPGQKELVRAKVEGREPDPIHGVRGKQRSVHNTYFTLPVLFTMISSHYAMTYGHARNWLILAAIAFAGAAIRVYFVSRHKGGASPLPAIAGVVALALVAFAIAPAFRSTGPAAAAPADEFGRVSAIVQARCAACHAQAPTQPGFAIAPKGVMLDTPDRIATQAVQINQQVSSRVMPLANLTGMTDVERETIAQWFGHGALTK
ncbi:MAG: urate hydroxylase PuuD [Betaproteobacteria bacterium]|nr:urate hydroxylase PuuD [Betaproteobacteria bacterium]